MDVTRFFAESPNKALLPEDLRCDEKLEKITRCPAQDLRCDVKLDGSNYAAHFDLNEGRVRFRSKRASVSDGMAVEKTDNLPHLTHTVPYGCQESLLLGEICSPQGFKRVMSIMGAKPEKAVARQQPEQGGPLEYVVFDCVMFNMTDIRSLPYAERFEYAKKVVQTWGNPHVRMTNLFMVKEAQDLYSRVVMQGGEGVMVKSMTAPYGTGLFKCKKHFDVSVFVSGYTEAEHGVTGKFAGLIGAVKFSVYNASGSPVEIGQASGMIDEIRGIISHDPKAYLGRVFDVRCQPPDDPKNWKAKNDRLRHPRFLRFRNDLARSQCTEAKVRQDFMRMMRIEA